jgi:hypothetical protein
MNCLTLHFFQAYAANGGGRSGDYDADATAKVKILREPTMRGDDVAASKVIASAFAFLCQSCKC